MTDPVLFERDGAVATIRLNRPDRLNAIDAEAAHLLLEACRRAEHEDGLRALVLAGEGRAFLAGGDVGAFHEAGDGVQEHVRGLIGLLEETITVLDRLRMPVIVRVQGAVAGAGMSLMLTGDVVIAADDTKLAFAYGSIGTTPDGGLSWALPRAVGHLRAMRIALLGEAIDAEEALGLGLVTKVVPRDELDAATAKVAGRLAAGPTQAYARTRELLRSSWRHTLAEQLALERQSFVASAGTEDFREGVAAFVERRRPEFRGSCGVPARVRTCDDGGRRDRASLREPVLLPGGVHERRVGVLAHLHDRVAVDGEDVGERCLERAPGRLRGPRVGPEDDDLVAAVDELVRDALEAGPLVAQRAEHPLHHLVGGVERLRVREARCLAPDQPGRQDRPDRIEVARCRSRVEAPHRLEVAHGAHLLILT